MGILSWVSLALVGYVAVSLLWHLNLSLLGKGILLFIFIVISQKFSIFAALGGQMFNPEMSRTALLIWESLYNILLVLVPLLIIKDVGYWVTKGVGLLAGRHFVWPLSTDWVKWGLLLFFHCRGCLRNLCSVESTRCAPRRNSPSKLGSGL